MDLRTAKSIFARHGADFVVAYVFGSVAAGSADEHSDIDVILVRHTALPYFDRVREVMDLRLALGAADLLIYTPAELEEMLAEEGRYFVKQAVRTGAQDSGLKEPSREADRWLRQAEDDLRFARRASRLHPGSMRQPGAARSISRPASALA